MAYTMVVLAISRKPDSIGVVSVVTFGFGVLLSWASGGSALALELQGRALTGLIGLGRNNARYR